MGLSYIFLTFSFSVWHTTFFNANFFPFSFEFSLCIFNKIFQLSYLVLHFLSFPSPPFSTPLFWDISLPFVHLTTSSSVAYSRFAPQFRYSFPWKRPRWTGNGKKLLTHLPAGGRRVLHRRWPLPLKLHFLCGRSGILLAAVCFTSFAWFCSSWPTAGSS